MKKQILRIYINVALFLGATNAYADTKDTQAGSIELKLFENIFTGNIGLTIGLLLMIVAIWRGLVKGDVAGALVLTVIAVAITLLPGVYNGLMSIACPIATAFGGHCGGS